MSLPTLAIRFARFAAPYVVKAAPYIAEAAGAVIVEQLHKHGVFKKVAENAGKVIDAAGDRAAQILRPKDASKTELLKPDAVDQIPANDTAPPALMPPSRSAAPNP